MELEPNKTSTAISSEPRWSWPWMNFLMWTSCLLVKWSTAWWLSAPIMKMLTLPLGSEMEESNAALKNRWRETSLRWNWGARKGSSRKVPFHINYRKTATHRPQQKSCQQERINYRKESTTGPNRKKCTLYLLQQIDHLDNSANDKPSSPWTPAFLQWDGHSKQPP